MIEQLETAAIDCVIYSRDNGRLPAGVMFGIAIANSVDPKSLMLRLEELEVCRKGATRRFEGVLLQSGHTWKKLENHFHKRH